MAETLQAQADMLQMGLEEAVDIQGCLVEELFQLAQQAQHQATVAKAKLDSLRLQLATVQKMREAISRKNMEAVTG